VANEGRSSIPAYKLLNLLRVEKSQAHDSRNEGWGSLLAQEYSYLLLEEVGISGNLFIFIFIIYLFLFILGT
jgi:hypothetical protein